MPDLDFESSEYLARHSRVRAAMSARGIDLLIVISPVNLNWLIGFRGKSYQEFQCLLFPLEEGPLVLQTRLAEVAELTDLTLADEVVGWGGREPEDPMTVLGRLLRDHGHLSRRIGLETPAYYLSVRDYLALRELLGDRLVHDATRLVEDLKLVKSPAEIALIRRAAAIADRAMAATRAAIAPGVSELEVVGETLKALAVNGSDQAASPINFVTGERTCYGHGAPSERIIRPGDFMHIELGAAYHRYAATLGRQLYAGEPTARMRELYRVVREACDACIERMRAGVPAVEPHRAACALITEAGLDPYRVHTTGYGIAPGFPPSWGESIHMFGDSPYLLQPGMVLSVEPPVLIPAERLGARIIDDVLITESGAEILSRDPRDLAVL